MQTRRPTRSTYVPLGEKDDAVPEPDTPTFSKEDMEGQDEAELPHSAMQIIRNKNVQIAIGNYGIFAFVSTSNTLLTLLTKSHPSQRLI